MQIIADLHIHSKYSRACSKRLILEEIDKYCSIKGVNIIGTGDFTHPIWFNELKNKLVEVEDGLYILKTKNNYNTRFLCSTEISCIYSKNKKVRKIHVCILSPSLEVSGRINKALSKIGNLKSDGRPVLGLDAKDLLKICLNIDIGCMIIPAHIWTPWFSMFGSKSGFDSIEECFEEEAQYIYMVESGLSSDPSMNWRVKNLDKVSIISNSDAHSLPNIAREANVLDIRKSELSYDKICRVMKERKLEEFLYTIEFYPEEGAYYFDGHRNCKISFSPTQRKENKNICPKCNKHLTIGVASRVDELSDSKRKMDYSNNIRTPFKKLIGLDKIIAECLGIKFRGSVKVQNEYMNLINHFGTEFNILLNVNYRDMENKVSAQIIEGIRRVREERVFISPGFDGEYGKVKIFNGA